MELVIGDKLDFLKIGDNYFYDLIVEDVLKSNTTIDLTLIVKYYGTPRDSKINLHNLCKPKKVDRVVFSKSNGGYLIVPHTNYLKSFLTFKPLIK